MKIFIKFDFVKIVYNPNDSGGIYLERNKKITLLLFFGLSFLFIVCVIIIFFFNHRFSHWHTFFDIFSLVSTITYIAIGYRLDFFEDIKILLLSIVWPSILSCIFWFFLLLLSFSGENPGMLGGGITWVFYYPIISHSLAIINLFEGVVEPNVLLVLPFNFMPVLLFLIGIHLKLRIKKNKSF